MTKRASWLAGNLKVIQSLLCTLGCGRVPRSEPLYDWDSSLINECSSHLTCCSGWSAVHVERRAVGITVGCKVDDHPERVANELIVSLSKYSHHLGHATSCLDAVLTVVYTRRLTRSLNHMS